jgi:hypothetical protein
MLEEIPAVPPARRIGPVARALRPLQQQIGQLQEDVALLIARNLYAMRKPGDRVSQVGVAAKRQALVDALFELDEVAARLPEGLRADSRLSDIRVAVRRLDHALDILNQEPKE